MAAKLTLTLDKTAEHTLAERAERLKPRGAPIDVDPVGRSIHFLRGVNSRAMMTLPAFYLFLGANLKGDKPCAIEGYPGVVLKHALRFSSVDTISLSCRKAFDHGPKGLTGANFSKSSDEILAQVAEYWSGNSGRSFQEAFAALILLRSVFRDCSKAATVLLSDAAPLAKRIGLLKQHADRSAAHISLEDYEFSTLDCAHVVAALTVIGEIIRSLDGPNAEPTYFDKLDEASLDAARQLFPGTPEIRLFEHMQIEMQSRLCWRWGIDRGRRMILEQLPYAIGWF
jgi:hypothetical protein